MTSASSSDSTPPRRGARVLTEAGFALFAIGVVLGLVVGQAALATTIARVAALAVLAVALLIAAVARRTEQALLAGAGVAASLFILLTR